MLLEYREWQDEQKERLGDQWQETYRLFTTWNGGPIHPDSVTGWFSDFIKKHSFNYVTLHSLRHTFATRASENNIPAKTVSQILGHSNIAITLDLYTPVTLDNKREAIDSLDYLFA